MQRFLSLLALYTATRRAPFVEACRQKGGYAAPKPGLRVRFVQTIKKAGYIWHLYDLIQYFVGTQA